MPHEASSIALLRSAARAVVTRFSAVSAVGRGGIGRVLAGFFGTRQCTPFLMSTTWVTRQSARVGTEVAACSAAILRCSAISFAVSLFAPSSAFPRSSSKPIEGSQRDPDPRAELGHLALPIEVEIFHLAVGEFLRKLPE